MLRKMPRTADMSRRRPRRMGFALKRFFAMGALAIVSVFGVLSFIGDNGILDWIKLKALHQNLQKENSVLLLEQDKLRDEIRRLNDPRYIEFLARERLGLMKVNEIFLILSDSVSHSPVDIAR